MRRRRVGLVALAAISASAGISRVRRRRRPKVGRGFDLDSLRLDGGLASTVVASDGAQLAVSTAGAGPVVVFAHGWTEGQGIWSSTAAALVASGHRVVVYDQRGHGDSTVGAAGITIDRLGLDLRDILVTLDLGDVVLVGHSMGGMTVMALLGTQPQGVAGRVAAAVLVSTAAAGLGGHEHLDALVGAALASRLITRAFSGRLGPKLTRRSVGSAGAAAPAAATAALFARTSGQTRRDCFMAMSTMDLRSGLGSVACPVTVVVGSRDHLTPPRHAREIAQLIRGARLVVLPDIGHQLPMESPTALAEIIAAARGTGVAAPAATDGRLVSAR